MFSPTLHRQSGLCILEGFEEREVLLINLLYVSLAGVEIQRAWSTWHRHKHTALPNPAIPLLLSAHNAHFIWVQFIECCWFFSMQVLTWAVAFRDLPLSVACLQSLGVVTAGLLRWICIEEVGSCVLFRVEHRFLGV